VEAAILPMPGVVKVDCNFTTKTLFVEHNPKLSTPKQLEDKLNAVGLEAQLKEDLQAAHSADPTTHSKWPKWNIIVSGLFLLPALVSYAKDADADLGYLKYAAIGTILFGIPPILKKAWASLRRCAIDVNILMTTAVIGACAMGDFTEGGEVVFLFAISEWLEQRATARARDMIAAVLSLKPDMAVLAANDEEVPVEQVEVGTLLKVLPGAKIPLDGEVTYGSTSIDESALTGESKPIKKQKGDTVMSGTTNSDGMIEIKTTSNAEDSTASKLIELVEEAQTKRSPTQQIVDQFARVYTPIMVISAILMAAVPWAFIGVGGWNETDAMGMVKRALEFLVIACPCALVISTPIVYVCTLAVCAQNNMLIKGGVFLETLANLGAIAIDKTGTLTQGNFQVVELEMVPNTRIEVDGEPIDEKKMLMFMASVENMSQHPMARPLVDAALAQGVTISKDVSDFEVIKGEGVRSKVMGTMVQVGNFRMAKRLGWTKEYPAEAAKAQEWEKQAGTIGFVGVDSALVGLLCVNDKIRDEAGEAMRQLADLGVHTVMLTGDNDGAAQAIRIQANMGEAKSELLPQDKTTNIELIKKDIQYQRRSKVAMVGDGINDTPALSASDIGIAIGGGTAAAVDTADAVLQNSNLLNLPTLVILGRRCQSKIKQNILISVISKVIMISLVAANLATLWLAVLADVGTMLLVVLNGMTLLRFKAAHVHE